MDIFTKNLLRKFDKKSPTTEVRRENGEMLCISNILVFTGFIYV